MSEEWESEACQGNEDVSFEEEVSKDIVNGCMDGRIDVRSAGQPATQRVISLESRVGTCRVETFVSIAGTEQMEEQTAREKWDPAHKKSFLIVSTHLMMFLFSVCKRAVAAGAAPTEEARRSSWPPSPPRSSSSSSVRLRLVNAPKSHLEKVFYSRQQQPQPRSRSPQGNQIDRYLRF